MAPTYFATLHRVIVTLPMKALLRGTHLPIAAGLSTFQGHSTVLVRETSNARQSSHTHTSGSHIPDTVRSCTTPSLEIGSLPLCLRCGGGLHLPDCATLVFGTKDSVRHVLCASHRGCSCWGLRYGQRPHIGSMERVHLEII